MSLITHFHLRRSSLLAWAMAAALMLPASLAEALPTSRKKNQKPVPKDVRLPIIIHKMGKSGEIMQRVVFKRIFRGSIGQTNVFHFRGWKIAIAPQGGKTPFVLQLDPRLRVQLSYKGDFVGKLNLEGRFVPYRGAYLFEGQSTQTFTSAGGVRYQVAAGFPAARPSTSISLKKN